MLIDIAAHQVINIAVTDRYTTFLSVSLSINTPLHHITIAVTDRYTTFL
jgi:hypothetical protein